MAAAAFLLFVRRYEENSVMSVGGKTLIILLHQKESFGVEETIRNLDFLLKDTRILLPLYFKPIRNQLF
jgi:hypothetical protein